ncbi:MAG: AAA family ATPase, partial [Pyrobaculum sp.]
DVPPPEKDLGLCIGKHVAWQSPLHKEAVKRVLTQHD